MRDKNDRKEGLEIQEDPFMCFRDYQKAFDTVKHEDLLSVLSRLDIEKKGLKIIRNLYYEQTSTVRVEN